MMAFALVFDLYFSQFCDSLKKTKHFLMSTMEALIWD